MSFIKKISKVLLLLVITLTTILISPKAFAEDAAIGGMDMDVKITSVNFEKDTRNLVVDFMVKNQSPTFISGASYSLVAFKGDKFVKEGDPFASMDFVFATDKTLGDLYPQEEKVFQLKTVPPASINTGNYFFLLSLGEATHNHAGITNTESPLVMFGTGGYLGGIDDTYFRTKNGDDAPQYGFQVKTTDSASIIIPLETNKKIADYVSKNEIFANVVFTEAARPDKVINTYTKEKLKIVTEKGKKLIKYDVKPWLNMNPAPYSVNFTIVNKDGVQVVGSANYRWWVNGYKARIDNVKATQNYYKKGEKLNIQLGTIVYDPFVEKTGKTGQVKLVITSVEGKEYSFVKDTSLATSSSVNFLEQSFPEKTTIKKIDISLIEKEGGKVLDSLSFNLNPEVRIGSKGPAVENLYYYLLAFFLVTLLLLIVFKDKKTRIVLVILAIIFLAGSVISYVNAADTDTVITNASYDGSALKFKLECYTCLNGVGVSWQAGGQSGSWSMGHVWHWKNNTSYVVYGSGCSASISTSPGAHCTGNASWSTNSCPVNGKCGSATTTQPTVKPTANLCKAGTKSSVLGTGPWTWTCVGKNGGSTASCSTKVSSSFSNTLTTTKSGSGTGTVTGTGISCGSDCVENVASGTIMTLNASPSTGSTFVSWSGACSGTGACSVTMNINKTVNATFNNTGGGESCSDGIRNQDETGIDTGGVCDNSGGGASCSDGIRNQDETGIDTGGPCDDPVDEASCFDGILNQNEVDIDTGGICNNITPSNALNCLSLSRTIPSGTSNVNVNILTRWVATSNNACDRCLRIWSFNGVATTTNYSNTIDKIFTTVGTKVVRVQYASTTPSGIVVGSPCTANINITQTGGNTREI